MPTTGGWTLGTIRPFLVNIVYVEKFIQFENQNLFHLFVGTKYVEIIEIP